MTRRAAVVIAMGVALAACSPNSETADTTGSTTTTTTEQPLPTSGPARPDMDLTSPAFEDGEVIPVKYTCDGEDISPRLDVSFPPAETVTLALIVDDPDAPLGTWDHWVEFDIRVTGDEVVWEEGVPFLGIPGTNSWNITGYGGPCPPEGQDHRYFFTVYALDVEFVLPEGTDSVDLRAAMEGHILSETQLMGTYGR